MQMNDLFVVIANKAFMQETDSTDVRYKIPFWGKTKQQPGNPKFDLEKLVWRCMLKYLDLKVLLFLKFTLKCFSKIILIVYISIHINTDGWIDR